MRNLFLPFSFCLLLSTQSFGAGLEKDVMWSGKYVGAGGAAVSNVEGAEALFFNPAGIGVGKMGSGDVSINVSPTMIRYSGPITTANTPVEGDNKIIPFGGALASYNLTDKLAFALGAFASGGAKADFSNVQVSNYTYTPNIKTDLTITEFSFGSSYKVAPGFSVGAAWRMLMVRGEVASIKNIGSGNFIYADIDNLKKTKYDGLRFGMQYQNTAKTWGTGISFRNAVGFDAEGSASGEALVSSSSIPLTGTASTVSTVFPWQIAVGANAELAPSFRILLDYVYSHYETDKVLGVTGTITGTGVGTNNISSPTLNWQNMTNVHLGLEYALSDITLRAGYVYTSQVTPDNEAVATFPSPGAGYTYTLGAGKFLSGKAVELNGALEYSTVKGTSLTATVPGEYKSHALGLHLGGTYHF